MISANKSSLCVDVAEEEAGTCVDVAADDLGHVLMLLGNNRDRVIMNGCATTSAQISWQ